MNLWKFKKISIYYLKKTINDSYTITGVFGLTNACLYYASELVSESEL